MLAREIIFSVASVELEVREYSTAKRFTWFFGIMQRSQRKRSAPSWLKEKPYLKVRFTQDGYVSKVTESWKLKLEDRGQTLTGSLANYSFHIGQIIWCYWKTANEKEKAYFEGEIIEMWDDATIVQENLPNTNKEDDRHDVEGKKCFSFHFRLSLTQKRI